MLHALDTRYGKQTDLLSVLLVDPGRKTEVILRSLTPEEYKQLTQAKHFELAQCVRHSVYSFAARAGAPKNLIMTMR